MEVHLIWHNPKDPQNLGGGLGPEQQAWEVGPSRTCMDGCTHTPQPDMDGNKHTQCSRTWMVGRTHTHTHTQRELSPLPHPHSRNKRPSLQPGGGGLTLAPLSTMSQAIVLESIAPWWWPWERKQGPGGHVARSSWVVLQGTEDQARGTRGPVIARGQQRLFLHRGWLGSSPRPAALVPTRVH